MVLSLTNNFGMTEQEIRAVAPSVFATEAHESRGDRFLPIPSIQIIRALENVGYVPTFAAQTKPRNPDRVDYTKHVVRLRHRDALGMKDGEAPEIAYYNAADGSSAYMVVIGAFRFVCGNGVIFGKKVGTVRVYHRGPQTVVTQVVEGTLALADQIEERMEMADHMKAIMLSPGERLLLAEQAHSLRFPEGSPFLPAQLLEPRRKEDVRNDLWTTYNVIQENMIKGGMKSVGPSGRKRSTKRVNGVAQDLYINTELFNITEAMYLEKSR